LWFSRWLIIDVLITEHVLESYITTAYASFAIIKIFKYATSKFNIYLFIKPYNANYNKALT